MISQLSADHDTIVNIPGVITDRLAPSGQTNEDIALVFFSSPQTNLARQSAVVEGCRGGRAARGSTDSWPRHHISTGPPSCVAGLHVALAVGGVVGEVGAATEVATSLLASHRVGAVEIVQIVSVVVTHSNLEAVGWRIKGRGAVRLAGDQPGLEYLVCTAYQVTAKTQ